MRFKLVEDLFLESRADQERFKEWIGLDKVNGKTIGEIYFDMFTKLKQKIKSPYNDLYYWMGKKTPEQFKAYIDELNAETENRLQQRQKEEDGAELIYKDNDWYVYYITNYEASCKYGANTKWCITGTKRWSNGDGRSQWDKYASENIKMYFFIDRKNNKKYALALYPGKEFEIFNEEDLPLSYIPNAPILKELGVDYYTYDERKEFVNKLMNDEIPHNIVFDAINTSLHEDDDYIFRYIVSDAHELESVVDESIPENYFEYEATSNGTFTPEDYKKMTGEEFDDDWGWGGDMPNLDWETINNFGGDTKEETINNFLREFNNSICVFINDSDGGNDFTFYKSWEEFLYDMAQYFGESGESIDGINAIADLVINYMNNKGKD